MSILSIRLPALLAGDVSRAVVPASADLAWAAMSADERKRLSVTVAGPMLQQRRHTNTQCSVTLSTREGLSSIGRSDCLHSPANCQMRLASQLNTATLSQLFEEIRSVSEVSRVSASNSAPNTQWCYNMNRFYGLICPVSGSKAVVVQVSF